MISSAGHNHLNLSTVYVYRTSHGSTIFMKSSFRTCSDNISGRFQPIRSNANSRTCTSAEANNKNISCLMCSRMLATIDDSFRDDMYTKYVYRPDTILCDTTPHHTTSYHIIPCHTTECLTMPYMCLPYFSPWPPSGAPPLSWPLRP